MSALRDAIEEYLALRRSLGYTLRDVAYCLRAFVAFAEGEGAARVTIDLALRWASQSSSHELATVGTRLQMVRRFAQWRHATDPRTEVPPGDLLPARYHRHPPYLYSDEEISQLLRAARHLPSPAGLRGLTYYTLFGLLVVTGLRVSEGVALDETDVDLDAALLTIRRTKFGKSRLVPLHASTLEPLALYRRTMNRVLPRRPSAAFFVSEHGVRVTVWYWYLEAVPELLELATQRLLDGRREMAP
jgi:integrase/recombinase XerD